LEFKDQAARELQPLHSVWLPRLKAEPPDDGSLAPMKFIQKYPVAKRIVHE
jgi:hypothetical protein